MKRTPSITEYSNLSVRTIKLSFLTAAGFHVIAALSEPWGHRDRPF